METHQKCHICCEKRRRERGESVEGKFFRQGGAILVKIGAMKKISEKVRCGTKQYSTPAKLWVSCPKKVLRGEGRRG